MSEGRPTFEFVYAHHTPDNHARIIDALKVSDGQVLAVEATGESHEERRAIERVINRAFDPECDLRAAEIGHLLEYGDGFMDRIVTAFEDSGKTFSLIDISSEDRATKLVTRVEQLHRDLLYRLWDGSSYAELRDMMRKVLELDARAVTAREQIVLSQLVHLAECHPEHTVTVFQGADHTRVSHTLGRIATVRRIFVPVESEAPVDACARMYYPLYDQLLRRELFSRQVTDTDIDRLLEQYTDLLTR